MYGQNGYDPFAPMQKKRTTYLELINREDKYPHPHSQCIYHVDGTLHNPKFKVVLTEKDKAELFRADWIGSFNVGEEWFLTPQEAADAKKAKGAKAKEELADVKDKLKKA